MSSFGQIEQDNEILDLLIEKSFSGARNGRPSINSTKSLPRVFEKVSQLSFKLCGGLIYIRECGSTLYVGMAHTALPTNTNFRITFQLILLLEALYEDLHI